MAGSYKYTQHPHIEEHRKSRPPKTREDHVGFNGKLALILTGAVGTMWCAYLFAALALVVFPQAVKGGLLAFVQWVSQTFIQLVMLSVIMVGQSILGKAGDKRAEATFKDADATFHEAEQIQAHLEEQDKAMEAILARLEKLEADLAKK